MDTQTLTTYLDQLAVETPSWGFANSGTRFGTFAQPAAARTLEEKIDDAAQVQLYTGVTRASRCTFPGMIAKIGRPWAATPPTARWPSVPSTPMSSRIRNTSSAAFAAPSPRCVQKAIDMHQRCVDIARATGSKDISLWFADGTNYPGQDSFRERRRRLYASFDEIYSFLDDDMRLLIEYKFFEPAFYHTDLCDWGQVALLCRHLGPKATVLVDTGHHAQGVNIEHIVSTLLDENLLGGFHFNSRKYADDDLTVGSIDPYQLFLIFNELADAILGGDETAKACANKVAYMFDQSHNLKGKIEATIQSAINVQEAWTKAFMVDREALAAARAACDIVGAEECLKDAWNSDVRPLLRDWREARGIDPEPLAAFRRSGYSAAQAEKREALHGPAVTGGGYQ